MDYPTSSKVLARHPAEILQSMKNARVRREYDVGRSIQLDEANNDKVEKKSNTCQLDNCLVCEKETPFWLLTRNPTWYAYVNSLVNGQITNLNCRSSIMRVVFYALMKIFPEKQHFSLRTDVYRFVVDHWGKICVSKKRMHSFKLIYNLVRLN